MTTNKYTTLVSCRLDNCILDSIDEFCAGRSYRNRSNVINKALEKVFKGKNDSEICEFLYSK